MKTIMCISLAISVISTPSFAASNPFKKPVVDVVDTKSIDFESGDIEVKNPYEAVLEIDDRSLEIDSPDGTYIQADSRFSKASVVFVGSINGVKLYYDKESGEYLKDKSALKRYVPVQSSLPDLSKVNF